MILRAIYYSQAKTLDEANAMIPYLASIIRTTEDYYGKLILAQSEINTSLKNANSGHEYMNWLEWKTLDVYRYLDKINEAVLELEKIGADYTSIAGGIISVLGIKNKRQNVFLSYKKGDSSFSFWREPSQHFMHAEKIENVEQFA